MLNGSYCLPCGRADVGLRRAEFAPARRAARIANSWRALLRAALGVTLMPIGRGVGQRAVFSNEAGTRNQTGGIYFSQARFAGRHWGYKRQVRRISERRIGPG